MQYVGKIKEQLKDKDVVFLYLAFSSPEKSWRNAILEFQLNGKESAHYNLPEEQQRLLGKELSIKHYPTYILFDKEGNIAIPKAAQPSNGEKVIEQIETLLQK